MTTITADRLNKKYKAYTNTELHALLEFNLDMIARSGNPRQIASLRRDVQSLEMERARRRSVKAELATQQS